MVAALLPVGAVSLTISVFVVAAHLWALFRGRGETTFSADDKLLLVYFYAVIVIFLSVAILP